MMFQMKVTWRKIKQKNLGGEPGFGSSEQVLLLRWLMNRDPEENGSPGRCNNRGGDAVREGVCLA